MSKSKLTRKLIEGAVEANFTDFFVKFVEHNLYDWEIPGGYDVEDNTSWETESSAAQVNFIHFKGFDLYVAVQGTYDSYNGTEWYNCYFVKAIETKTVRFERVK